MLTGYYLAKKNSLHIARDRKFWWLDSEASAASHFCVHAYLLQFVCQGYSVVSAKKSHDIYVAQKKKTRSS